MCVGTVMANDRGKEEVLYEERETEETEKYTG